MCARCGAALTAASGGTGHGATGGGGRWACPLHGEVQPCWRAIEASYEAFAEHLVLSRGLPTWIPWPLPPGWAVADFGCVGGEGEPARATFATCHGLTPEDGGVSLVVVTEEPGVGLGAHLADVPHSDPGRAAWDQPPALRLRLDGASVPLWPVPQTLVQGDDDRTVLAGEAQGRWLWVVVKPAEAVLGLVDRASLGDASGLGPELVAVTFGSPAED
ncbi:hypothetical protein GCM10009815_33790 [Nocardioides marmoribigeumensis]